MRSAIRSGVAWADMGKKGDKRATKKRGKKGRADEDGVKLQTAAQARTLLSRWGLLCKVLLSFAVS